MDVNKNNFFWMLPSILYEAQNARYVTFDIEMSGIPIIHGRNSIQDTYAKIKEAAEQFQMVQLGLTFVRYDEKLNHYTTRTFTFSVSPLFPKSTLFDNLSRRLDRKFAYSVRAYDFLQQHKFNFTGAIENGNHYLSREEHRFAIQYCFSSDPGNEHIDPSSLDYQSQDFYERTRRQIAAFIGEGPKPDMNLVVKNPYGEKLNGLQIRLIHQVVREQFPSCAVVRSLLPGSVSIILVNKEASYKTEARRRWNMGEIDKLTGLQIIFEALSGGSFADRIKQEYVCRQEDVPEHEKEWNERNKAFDFEKCEASLKKNRPILVGHNIFMDLAYIYQSFFESLPSNVDDFLTEIHELFPRIADTKFMYGRGKHMMAPDRNLDRIYDSYAKKTFPKIKLELGRNLPGPHHAGFDSSTTANLFLKQSHALFIARKHLQIFNKEVHAPTKPATTDGEGQTCISTFSWSMISWPNKNSTSIIDDEDDEALRSLEKWNILDPDTASWESPTPSGSTTTSDEDRSKNEVGTLNPGEIYSEAEIPLIPLWSDAFWRAYGNQCSVPSAGYVSFESV
ncbi:CAF1-domain-containing protein [Daldinia caldariorum]|uniref:CAF1-domain-containing protein n=1 Tax=Daldinia caldariorum TaxID=326644 RepID=UPI0020078D5C|nr:CAF1-domain-containing protein [Daldinia caldariorum]KAI1464997.1 CAF1-domain-containing protein [Daldinia caldariorum]